MTDLVPKRMPWEPVPVAETVALLQRDFAYAVKYTAIAVHGRTELSICVNTPRGQIVPRGVCKLSDGSTFELQDIGMPQVGAPQMTINELMTHIWGVVRQLGLELEK